MPDDPSLVVAVAGTGLAGDRYPWPSAALGDDAWSALLQAVTRHRLVGLLDSAVTAGHLPVTPHQHEELGSASVVAAASCLLRERAALDAVGWLAVAGVDHRLLKGSALAHTVYPDAHLRTFGDVDVLVAPGRFDDAVRALEAGGCARVEPERRPGFDARFAKSTVMRHPDDFEIDLHRTLAPVPFGPLIHVDDLFATTVSASIGGMAVPVLDAESTLVHVSLHAVLSGPVRLMTLRDVAQVLPRADPGRTVDLATRWSVAAPTASAIDLAHRTFGLPPSELGDWAHGYRRSPRDERLLRPFERRGRAALPTVATTVRELPGVRARLAYAHAIVMPSRRYLRHRARSRRAFLRRALVQAPRPRPGEPSS
jgi:hypothetical protein